MKRILIATVAGAHERWLAAPAAQLAGESGASVTALAVDDVESQRFQALPRDELLAAAEREAHELAELVRAEGVEAEALVRSGRAASAVMECADELDADLIVVGAPSRRPVAARLLGSLAITLVERSERQVMVVTEPG
jgi:nucleotide-binding universal stress UspA family protein